MKRIWICLLSLALAISGIFTLPGQASDAGDIGNDSAPTTSTDYGFSVDAKGAILMEATTGTVLYEQNASAAYPPASVTKIMTLLLVMEAVDSGKIALTDRVPVSEYAASMGGSQVFLEAGEEMTVEEMIKCTVISSANDAAVALAEFVSGSESAFVGEMNARAAALGMKNSSFENVTGLDDTTQNHVTSAEDIAIMSRALIAHPLILKYSSIWMDTIRDGTFTLTNTNRLVRYYQGATGLKTGSTAKAKFCISVTATRGNMTLIAVIMGSPTRDVRNDAARKLLDYGFANYALFEAEGREMDGVRVMGGVSDSCTVKHEGFSFVVKKGELNSVESVYELPKHLIAPLGVGAEVGKVSYRIGERELGCVPIKVDEAISKITFWKLFGRICERIFFS